MSLADLLGPELLTGSGETQPTAQALAGKTAVGLYFSAHWCPPCRGFTPKLASMYSDVFKAKGMEIVFVSSDHDEGAFKEYHGTMPWLAVPFAARDVKSGLDNKFKVSGIPSLVILGPDGELITKEGRKAVVEDPEGKSYPWRPPSAAEEAAARLSVLGSDVVAQCEGKFIGLYFSAHWCPPCRGFTPKLAEYYNGGLKDKMEIVFVSSDRDEASFKEYFGEMPWKALPFEKREEKAKLSQLCSVEGIPMLVVLRPDGTLVTSDGRSKVTSDPSGASLPDGWLPQPFNDLNDDPSDINVEQCVIALGESAAMAAAVEAVARKHHEKAGKRVEAMPYRFFKAPAGEITEKVRSLLEVNGDKLVFTDFSAGGHYYVGDEATSAEAVEAFIADVDAGKVERRTASG